MAPATIDNPVINSPFAEPAHHFEIGKDGPTGQLLPGRRKSTYLTPVPQPKRRAAGGQQSLIAVEEERENELINDVRRAVRAWRAAGHPYITEVSRFLLGYWANPERDKKLFFCQIEALETAIYLAEAASRDRHSYFDEQLKVAAAEANPLLFRIAFKMATGSGKTVVMAMLIAWQTLNKFASPNDSRFTDSFLIVTPGVTIRDRLRVVLPNDPQNYYKQRDLLPPRLIERLQRANIVITNYHAFLPRENIEAARLTKDILKIGNGGPSPFTETPAQVVNRVCKGLLGRQGIIVINDEAHHCYRHRTELDDGAPDEEKLAGDERKEAEKREETGRVWISGLEAVKQKIGVKTVYDLSATPFFLRGSGYREGKLFPWVVSDFALIDAIESGIVKVPRVPVADDTMTGDAPVYRDLWLRIRDHLPKRRNKKDQNLEPNLPKELEGALHSLYGSYRAMHEQWETERAERPNLPPPVMIVVCSNTVVSKMVYDWISGYERTVEGHPVIVPGQLTLFRNENGRDWLHRPNSILIDSEALESGEGLSDEFMKAAAHEIETFKAEYRLRYPERDSEAITAEDLLREVLNTVGKEGRLGGGVKCVVSVSMLTEGWDANTVTHILGVRAFSTQLLQEQVIGRGLRRMSYIPDEHGLFEPEYAEVYGVPFSFLPVAGAAGPVKRPPIPTHIFALPERAALEITFPRLTGYRYDTRDAELKAVFTPDSHMALSAADVPMMTENAPIIGKSEIHTLEDLENRRQREVEFLLARQVLETYFREGEDGTGAVKLWYFPQVLKIVERWLRVSLTLKDGTFVQLLLLTDLGRRAAEKIMHAIQRGTQELDRLLPILDPAEPTGSTADIDFETTRTVFQTHPGRCHLNYVAEDSGWESKLAQTLEQMDTVVCYFKNERGAFIIPYVFEGEQRRYVPDFIARMDDGHGPDDLLNLIIEVSGQRDEHKKEKAWTARELWVPAVNQDGRFGRWNYIEITDPYNALTEIGRVVSPAL